jgi:hypothetical protein
MLLKLLSNWSLVGSDYLGFCTGPFFKTVMKYLRLGSYKGKRLLGVVIHTYNAS